MFVMYILSVLCQFSFVDCFWFAYPVPVPTPNIEPATKTVAEVIFVLEPEPYEESDQVCESAPKSVEEGIFVEYEGMYSTMAWNGMMYGSSGSASAHHPVGFTLAARSLGSNGDCRPYGSTRVPRPSDSALVSCSAYVTDIRAFACALALHPRRAPPSLRLCLDPQSHWLCLCPLAKFNSDMTKIGNIWVDELHWFRFRSFVPATLNMDLFYLKMPSKKSSQCPLHLQMDI